MAPELTPEILFEDTHLAVLSKPAGLLSQGEKTGDANLVDWLRGHFGRNYVGLVHRLDRNTSGLMVVAKRSKSAQRLTDALQAGGILRAYLAWVEGDFPPEARWKHRLKKDPAKNLVRVVREGGQEAALHARRRATSLYQGVPVSLVELVLETGRSHQIRVQAAHEGFPLLGDVKYGAQRGAGRAERPRFPRTALHSYLLEFEHPMSKERMKFETGLPPDLRL